MLLLAFIYRIISALVTIFIVVPLWIVYCIITFFFTLFNNLIYVNLININVPKEVLEQNLSNNLMLLKILTAISTPLVEFWHNLKNLKTIRF
jgi:hypothetical protein